MKVVNFLFSILFRSMWCDFLPVPIEIENIYDYIVLYMYNFRGIFSQYRLDLVIYKPQRLPLLEGHFKILLHKERFNSIICVAMKELRITPKLECLNYHFDPPHPPRCCAVQPWLPTPVLELSWRILILSLFFPDQNGLHYSNWGISS